MAALLAAAPDDGMPIKHLTRNLPYNRTTPCEAPWIIKVSVGKIDRTTPCEARRIIQGFENQEEIDTGTTVAQ